MSRYIPSPEEQEAIDFLTLKGWKTVRQGTYDRLHERVRVAEQMQHWETERRESVERWAQSVCNEERRARERVVEVCAFAFTHGATTDDLVEFNDLIRKDRT